MNRIYLALIALSLTYLGMGCGQKASPQGGPRDKEPPTVTSTSPDDSTLNFSNTTVRFSFSEPIRKPSYGKEIFISPFVERPKITLSDNARRVKIDFQEDLRPQTTYLVTLSEVKDQHESNPLEETYILAFSTGDQLDSMEIKGAIIPPTIGSPPEKMKVLLFDADSIKEDKFLGIRPAYISQSDGNGDFSFKYLRNAPYRILGVSDADNSNTYNNPAEMVAISPDSLLLFEDDSLNFTTAKLFSFQPDNALPRLRNAIWIADSTLRLRFTKGLRIDSLLAFSTDTLGQDSLPILEYSYLQESEVDVFVHMPRGKDSISQIHLSGLQDSLGKRLDTVVTINPFRREKQTIPLLIPPKLLPEKGGWELYLPSLYRQQENWVFVTDTAREERTDTLELEIEQEGFNLLVKPLGLPDTVGPLWLKVQGEIADSSLRDSVFRFPLKWFEVESFGTLTGSVRLDSPYQPPIILHLINEQKQIVRTVFDTTFAFAFLPAGNYSTQIIFDADSNGIWTPGAIKGRKLPEKIYTPTGTVEIRENWDYDDYIVEVLRPGAKPPEESGEPGEEPDGSEEEPEGD